jgi:hypothetical protein
MPPRKLQRPPNRGSSLLSKWSSQEFSFSAARCVILRGGLHNVNLPFISCPRFTTINSFESVPKSSTGSAALQRELAVAVHLHPLASCTVVMKPYRHREYQNLVCYVSSKSHGGELRRYENIPQHATLPSITGTESISLFCKKSVHAIFRVRFSPLFLGGRCCGSGAGTFCGGEQNPWRSTALT